MLSFFTSLTLWISGVATAMTTMKKIIWYHIVSYTYVDHTCFIQNVCSKYDIIEYDVAKTRKLVDIGKIVFKAYGKSMYHGNIFSTPLKLIVKWLIVGMYIHILM